MVTFEIYTWLEDIQRSIDEIFDFLPEKRDFFEFQKDLKTRKAVERNLEIIGEALNRIIHGYDNVSEDIIWLIVNRSLPKLKIEVDNLLK